MDQKLDVLLVGPWERVLKDRGLQSISNYVQALKLKEFIGKVIYSSSDPKGTVPLDIFDSVVSTYRGVKIPTSYQNGNTSYATSKSEFSPYIENVKAGLKYCSAKFIIRIRSDLELKEIEEIFFLLTKYPQKIFIDYHPEHSLLIPFYYSDMFLAARATSVYSLYKGDFKRNSVGKKKLSFNPFKYLSAGFWDAAYQHPEVLFWFNALKNIEYIKKNYTFANIFYVFQSLIIINKKIILLDRNRVFVLHQRFNLSHNWNNKLIFPWKFSIYSRLIIKHLFKFYNKSFYNLINKISNLY